MSGEIEDHILTENLLVTANSSIFYNNNSYFASTPSMTNDSEYADHFPEVAGDIFQICAKFLPLNHWYFQTANSFLLLSYLAPNGIYGILYLRITLAVGSFFFALWGYVTLCAIDTFLWNAIFLVINFVHAVIIIYHLRPVKLPKNLENLYKQLFLPLRVSRQQFKLIADCMKEIQTLKPREIFASERITKVDKLSLVLTGRFMVSQDGKPLNFVTANQFLDSPEWFGMSTDEYFQVTVIAVEESSVLVWNRDKLKLTINGDSFLPAVFDHILGKDVVNKLMQVNETCLSNGAVPSGLDYDSNSMEKPQYIVHRSEGYEGMSGNTRQIQDAKRQEGLPYEIEPLLDPPADASATTIGSINNDIRETSIC